MPYAHNAPFRYDVVGSFLRPDVLKQARADHAAGVIDDAALKAVEDEAIRDLVAKQKAAGLHVITDGEFRRSYWHLDFMWGLGGIERRTSRTGYMFHDEETTADTAVVTGKISGENHPFVEHFKFVKALEEDGQVARQTMPAPAQTYSEVILDRCDGQVESLRSVYADDEDLIADIAAAYRTVIADLYAAGCRSVQFDDCTWGIYCDARLRGKDRHEARRHPEGLRAARAPSTMRRSRASPPTSRSPPTSAAATTTPPTPSRAATTPSRPTSLRMRTSTPSTSNSTPRAPAPSSRSRTWPTARRSFSAS